MRKVHPNGEALAWCRKCSGYARCRLGPIADEYGKMLNIILQIPEERVPDRSARGREVEVYKRRVSRKECKRLREEFEVGGFIAQDRFVEHCQKRTPEDSGALRKEEGNIIRKARPCTKKTSSVVG